MLKMVQQRPPRSQRNNNRQEQSQNRRRHPQVHRRTIQLRQLLRRLEKSTRRNEGKPEDESGTNRKTQSISLNTLSSNFFFSKSPDTQTSLIDKPPFSAVNRGMQNGQMGMHRLRLRLQPRNRRPNTGNTCGNSF